MGNNLRRLRGLFLSLFCLLVPASSAGAQDWVEGLANRGVYTDRVSFIVPSVDGYETTAALNGVAIATDVQTTVEQADYYELQIDQRDLVSAEYGSQLTQFIIRDSRRGTSEQGLRTWTPYPSTASAAAELADAHLQIIAPAAFPLGLEIPIIARVENKAGTRLGVNGAITAVGFPDHPLRLLRGVGSVFLPAATEAGLLTWTGQIHALRESRTIAVETNSDWRDVSGTIDTDTDWDANARIRMRGDADNPLTVAPGATLTIGAGSVIVVDPDTTIVIEGHIIVNGTLKHPVVFTSANRQVPWGGFLFESGGTRGTFTGTILTASGADPDWLNHHPGYGMSHRVEQCLFFLADGAQLTLTDCYLVENHGQAGHGESAELTMTRCLVQKCITAGQYNHGFVVLNDCALIEFPSADSPFLDEDNDALYLTGGAHFLTNCLIGWALDDGIDAGSGAAGSVTVEACWIEACYHEGMAWSESRDARASDTVTINCGQGIECGFGLPDVNAVGCLSTANLIGARFGDNYNWTYGGFLGVRDSLLLFNDRDVWGRAWDDWTVHTAQMDIRDNYLTTSHPDFPDNAAWTPQDDPNQAALLEPFRPTSGPAVGVALAVATETLDMADLPDSLPVRLSTFTTVAVSVDYRVETDTGLVDGGTLHFEPGRTVQQIALDEAVLAEASEVRVTLKDPVHAELTGLSQVTYRPMAASDGT